MSNQMARAADIINTMATPGWREIIAEAQAVVEEAKKRLMQCNEDAQVLRLQHEAKAAEQFLERLDQRIADATSVQPEADFQPVAY